MGKSWKFLVQNSTPPLRPLSKIRRPPLRVSSKIWAPPPFARKIAMSRYVLYNPLLPKTLLNLYISSLNCLFDSLMCSYMGYWNLTSNNWSQDSEMYSFLHGWIACAPFFEVRYENICRPEAGESKKATLFPEEKLFKISCPPLKVLSKISCPPLKVLSKIWMPPPLFAHPPP